MSVENRSGSDHMDEVIAEIHDCINNDLWPESKKTARSIGLRELNRDSEE